MSFKLIYELAKRRAIFFLHIILIFLFAMIFNKHFEMLLFIVGYKFISLCFNKQFHADTLFDNEPIRSTKWCKIITIIVELLYLYMCKKYNLSIYSNLFLILVISVISGLLQFFLERVIVYESKLRNKDTLLILCAEANLTQEATNRMVMRYIDKLKVREIASIEYVEEKTIKESLRRSKRKMNL